ncbi:alanine/ornithine racemase family PLP-dependent enzyme [Dysgonomonas sp. 511]|uniref:alanine/ornithine racemase family PLP-dependent enzyme n=1 Tax=Dysgonomonas sp. 511 TaxID=2302930 RepID=UPI0013D46B10|nr:alanine/ornithine racemase family PLP-dependent enzyme [Dysgonomonas sp. 511]NDV79790.1 alanine/ornithine racemase family PLP-dependent enzyme [Dysgonomonas sp. 511]
MKMKYPAITINKTKFKENLEIIHRKTTEANISVCAVTKGFCAMPELVKLYADIGFSEYGDSRLDNLLSINVPNSRKWMLRLPMISQAEETVRFSDISLNSEIETIRALGAEALKAGKHHKIVLAIEKGDLREGVMSEDAVVMAGEILTIDGIELLGIATNFNCFGGIIPDVDKLNELVRIAEEIEQIYGIRLGIISGGNSGSAYMIENGELPSRINNLRIGELILCGRETSYQRNLWELHTDIFTMQAEIVECKTKPSLPYGNVGLDAFGKTPLHVDKGLQERAIIAVGKQDVSMDYISPRDKELKILGGSSDHFIIDVTHSCRNYKVGDIVEFDLSYGGILNLFTSKYINKVIL